MALFQTNDEDGPVVAEAGGDGGRKTTACSQAAPISALAKVKCLSSASGLDDWWSPCVRLLVSVKGVLPYCAALEVSFSRSAADANTAPCSGVK